MRRLLTFTAMLILVFGLLIAALRGIGYAKPLPPALAEFQSESCPLLSCWHGIRVGTTNREVLRLLSNDKNILLPDYQSDPQIVCWRWRGTSDNSGAKNCYHEGSEKTYSWFHLNYSLDDLRLRDLIILFGYPIGAQRCIHQTFGTYEIGSLYFWNATLRKSVSASIKINDSQEYLSQEAKVVTLSFTEEEEETPTIPQTLKWPNFVRWKDIQTNCG